VRVAQIVSNLVTNAARYTEPGGEIAVSLARRDTDLVLRVRDTGAGIPEALLPRVFEIFTRGGRTIERSAGGLGLGLAIVKSLTELHGGQVRAHSDGPGRGTEIEVALPARESSMPAPRARTPIASTRPPIRPASGHILIVDDNIDAADLLAEALTEEGFPCIVSHGPLDALALARARRPRLALVDIGLPGIDGYELGRRLHAEPGYEALPIVALTGFGQEIDRRRSAAEGFAEHLVKPVQVDQIVALLERLIGRT
jgi:CheY-like chemotaxis protein/anti-sigma regulatory factor (Ser/Thr protein kinase)